MIKHRDDKHDTAVLERDTKAEVTPLAASGLTVTVANPTPPTNIPYVTTGSPPVISADAALVPAAGVSPKWGPGGVSPPGSITAIAAPSGGSGPAPEATGSVVVDNSKPGAVSLTVMGNYTNNPNASHPSSQAPATPPTITALAPASTPGTGGTMALTVTGTGFQQNSIIAVGGVAQTTNYVSPTTLEAPNAPKRSSAGTSPVTVVTNGTPTAATNWTFT
jgi:hypothetical protein